MAFRFTFATVQDIREARDVINFTRSQNLSYPNYKSWIERTSEQILSGEKEAIVVYRDRTVVASAIYQSHREIPSLCELKNMRVTSNLRGRNFGAFLLKQLEAEVKDKYLGIIGDVRENQTQIASFMYSQGFRQVATLSLYEGQKREIVMVKFFKNLKEGLMLPLERKIESHFGLPSANN